jgi:hypothetical protein
MMPGPHACPTCYRSANDGPAPCPDGWHAVPHVPRRLVTHPSEFVLELVVTEAELGAVERLGAVYGFGAHENTIRTALYHALRAADLAPDPRIFAVRPPDTPSRPARRRKGPR